MWSSDQRFLDSSGDNTVDSDLNVVRRLSVYIDLGGHKIVVAVDAGGVRRALGSFCPCFRRGDGTP